MPVVQINGISVAFPFQPYSVQEEYMAKIIESLKTKQNAILESPSGTGKTLSLLCATLGWIQRNGNGNKTNRFQKSKSFTGYGQRKQRNVWKTRSFNLSDSDQENEWDRPNPKVIYATRTHSQILQAMKELKKTAYHNVQATVIASRDRLCIHPKLKGKSNTDKILMCKNMMHKSEDGTCASECQFYQNIGNGPQLDNITDIEDLGSYGKKHECCPYYMAKKASVESDIIFIPYGYLIDPTIRESNDINLKDSIVILDEGHNVNRVCEDSASASIRNTEISSAIRYLNSISNESYCSGSHKIDNLKQSLLGLKEKLKSMPHNEAHSGGFLFELLESVNIIDDNVGVLESLITGILTSSNNQNGTEANQEGEANAETGGFGLKAVLRFLQTIFASPEKKRNSSYRMYIERKLKATANAQFDNSNGSKYETILHFWCFNPAIRLKSLLEHQIRCLILTSSTLTPFEPFIAELRVQFPIDFVSSHVIDKHQKFAKILTHGFGGELFDSVKDNRENENYLMTIARSVSEVSKVVPGGLLVFFPSYKFLEDCMQFWNDSDIWNEISRRMAICVESRDKDLFLIEMKRYYKEIREKRKAIILAVMRGNLSEGLDFSDKYGRAVMVVGVPLATWTDPKVKEKMNYLETARVERSSLPSGADWYGSDAIRTANQAMGRVIRHKNDYGAMLFCDRRFHTKKNQERISPWIQARLNTQKSFKFDEIVQELSLFYTNAEEKLEQHEPELNPESFILFDDDEWFSTAEHSESHADDSTAHSNADEADADADAEDYASDNPINLSDSNEVSDQQPINQQQEVHVQNSETPTTSTENQNHAHAMQDSGDESDIQPKRAKKSIKNTIESDSDSESDRSQNQSAGPLINFIKSYLGNDKYKRLGDAVSKYNSVGQYEQFRDELFEILKEPEFAFRLKACIILFTREHQPHFKKDSEQFIQSSR